MVRRMKAESEDSAKLLDAALSKIHRDFGEGAVMRLGDEHAVCRTEAISTGSIGLDRALGVGGLPTGRIVEIYGPESSGKTTLALHVLASAQAAGGRCAFVDAEHSLDPVYAQRLGVDASELLLSQPDCGEEALEITDILVSSGAVRVVVIDSVAALTPRAELEGEMGDSQVGLQGAPDEQGDAQAHRHHLAPKLPRGLHQPDSHEDRRDVRESGDHDRRQRTEILLIRTARHPANRGDQAPG